MEEKANERSFFEQEVSKSAVSFYWGKSKYAYQKTKAATCGQFF